MSSGIPLPQLRRQLSNARAWLRRLRLALTTGIDDWEATELWVQYRLRPAIDEHLELARDIDDGAFEISKGITTIASTQDLFAAHVALLARVMQDLRVAASAMALGYTMQGWSNTASAFEAAHTMGFLAAEPDRAQSWWKHTDVHRPFCGAKVAVEGCFKYLEIGTQGRQRVRFVEREYRHYEHLCVAKHINPISERSRYIGKSAKGTVVRFTPFYSSRRVREARFGLALACRAGVTALWVFQRSQLPDNKRAAALVVGLGERSGSVLANWNASLDAA